MQRAVLRVLLCLLACMAASLSVIPAKAHDARPVSVLIRELPGDRFALRVRAPDSVTMDNRPHLLPPAGCQPVTIGDEGEGNRATDMIIACTGGVQGREFELVFPIYNPSLSTLYRLEQLGAPTISALLPPSEAVWQVPQEPSRLQLFGDYLRLGMEHIFGGFDHLLFIAGLLIIAATWRRTLIALTGFTVAHSVTLALSTLELVRLPSAPVEAAIALSILFLAAEIVRGRKDSLTYRYPTVVASLFGLLHGFGFASVLREIGIPGAEIGTALLAFNLGVEAGQIVFVAAILGIAALASRLARSQPRLQRVLARPLATRVAAYALGTISVFWLFERVSNFA
ncbi:HupE/UreJ family protein [Alteraurantiacibacter aestuarii]|uniref:HupE/UreJ family protein n=1 Tax=Alteraurantiacibacter aestuarii TaxID=650004 RepID=A0A844ZQB3_9SPHN|nr:HupE/UreJ family protein [Alteraurantiacibacter aestuarii]MXO88987.1 HupE/UreJ family protein [Alteraurantiacibacter aestuarii]